MASKFLISSLSNLMTTLTVIFFLSLNCSVCKKSFNFLSFFITQKPTPLPNETVRRLFSLNCFLFFNQLLFQRVSVLQFQHSYLMPLLSRIVFLLVFYLRSTQTKTINIGEDMDFFKLVSTGWMFSSKTQVFPHPLRQIHFV